MQDADLLHQIYYFTGQIRKSFSKRTNIPRNFPKKIKLPLNWHKK